MRRTMLFILLMPFYIYINGAGISFSDLRGRIARDPAGALLLLDSLDTDSSYPSYKIDYLRSLAYRTQSRFYMAMHHARRALNTEEVFQDSVLASYSYMIYAEVAVLSYQLTDAAKIIAEGKHYADTRSDSLLKADMLQMEGDLYRRMGVLYKSYNCIQEAIHLLTGMQDVDNQENAFMLSHCMGYLMAYYIEDRKPVRAWEVGLEREKVLARLEEKSVAADTLVLDRHKGYFYSKMAYLAYKTGRMEESRRYARLFYSTAFSNTLPGNLEINDYLLETGDYSSVLAHNETYLSRRDPADSLSIIYLRTLYQSSKAYSAQKDYKNAYLVMLEAYNARNKMRISRERNQMLDIADITKAVTHEYELKTAAYKMKMQRRIIVGLTVFVLLLVVLLVGLLLALRTIRRKNVKTAALMLDLDDRRKEILRAEETIGIIETESSHPVEVSEVPEHGESPEIPAVCADESEEESLFFKFDHLVKERKLYLNYQLTRDDYASLMGVDRNRFAAILKKFTSGNLSAYINGMRLEYSVSLFREHPDWSINKVAEESALSHISTFYRLFKDKYGISPNSFRKTLL